MSKLAVDELDEATTQSKKGVILNSNSTKKKKRWVFYGREI
jgi:hypothetical protein